MDAYDTNGVRDSFIKDMQTGVTTRVSTDSNGGQATGGDSTVIDISTDGQFILFNSFATNLVTGDTNGTRDAFVKNLVTGSTTRVNTTTAGGQANAYSRATSISADGRFVLFNSDATNLVDGDTNVSNDAFLKDTLNGATIRVSTSSAGVEGNGNSVGTGLSADGRYVLMFSAANNLIANDTNGQNDIFVRDLTRVGIQQMAGMVVTDRSSAAVTLGLVQRAREEVLQYRSSIGATTSRISTFLSTLQTAQINYQAAESRIVDADIALEAANALRTRILQQTGAELLRQANAAPQIALELLRG